MPKVNPTRISGTKEWSVESVNCVLGCTHKCRYCYARANALRRKQIKSWDEWGTSYNRVRPQEVRKRRHLRSGRIMFPTTHDITPEHLAACLEVTGNLLHSGNKLLIVSKPHLECIGAMCREFRSYHSQILFRFSIGAFNDSILGYWEPGAPLFEERLACLRHAEKNGFATSVSAEPLLDADNAARLFRMLAPHVTDTIWFGKLNGIGYRVDPNTCSSEIGRIRLGQSAEMIRHIYSQLGTEPKVRWKESYKQLLGLELASRAGLDV